MSIYPFFIPVGSEPGIVWPLLDVTGGDTKTFTFPPL